MEPVASSTGSLPAAFIGHGSPMNTLEVNRFTQVWRDLGRALPRVLNAAYRKAGQVCTSVQRLYVDRRIVEAFMPKLVEAAQKMKAGDPADPATVIGPMISLHHAERAQGWVDAAVAAVLIRHESHRRSRGHQRGHQGLGLQRGNGGGGIEQGRDAGLHLVPGAQHRGAVARMRTRCSSPGAAEPPASRGSACCRSGSGRCSSARPATTPSASAI